MTPNQQLEELSEAYVTAVAASCGFKIGSWSQDDDCLDLTIGAPGVLGGGTLRSPKIDVQLKCSSDPRHEHKEHLVWSLRRDHYDKLRAPSLVPHLLVVVMLPADAN